MAIQTGQPILKNVACAVLQPSTSGRRLGTAAPTGAGARYERAKISVIIGGVFLDLVGNGAWTRSTHRRCPARYLGCLVMAREKKPPKPCQHLTAHWRDVGPEQQLRCVTCQEPLQRRFSTEPASKETLHLEEDGEYRPYNPKGWLPC